MIGKVIGIVLLGLFLAVPLSAFAALPVWLLWDFVAPVFGLPVGVGFLKCWALSFVCHCLFKTQASASS